MNSIKNSGIFNKFEILRLRKNMRADPDQKEFADWLCVIGAGKNCVSGTSEIELPQNCVADSLDALIDFCFQDLFNDPLGKSDKLADAAILAPKNDNVQYINELAMARMKGEAREYKSIDEPLENDVMVDVSIYRCDIDMEVLNNEMPQGMPPHKLTLKVG
jgi:hypothetical protein